MIASATGAEVLLVAVLPERPVLPPGKLDRITMHDHAERVLRELRDFMAPDARTVRSICS
jgi:hypothetical protein